MMWALHRKGGLMDVQGGVSAHPGLGVLVPGIWVSCACDVHAIDVPTLCTQAAD